MNRSVSHTVPCGQLSCGVLCSVFHFHKNRAKQLESAPILDETIAETLRNYGTGNVAQTQDAGIMINRESTRCACEKYVQSPHGYTAVHSKGRGQDSLGVRFK